MELESEPRSSRVNEYKDGMLDDPERAAEIAKFQCLVNDDYEDVVAYNDIVDYIEQDDSWDGVWKFKEILDISAYNLVTLTIWDPCTTRSYVGIR
jgi:hypothetical protein